MNRSSIIFIIFFVLFIASSACRVNPPESSDSKTPGREQMAEVNRLLVLKESQQIDAYIEQIGVDAEKSGTGLRWFVEEDGQGRTPGPGDIVTLEYECFLLDGTLCYSSAKDGNLVIRPGSTDIPAGLDEGVRMMKEGSLVHLIMPSYLAYGLTGDRVKIPARAPLHYKVRAVSIESAVER